MKIIKNKLQEHFDNNQINLSSFEQNAGFKRGVISNILFDKSKNPTIETIVKIADALDCSIDELLDREEYFRKYIKHHRSEMIYNKELFNAIFKTINQYIEDQQLNKVALGDVFYVAEEIYEYSMTTTDGNLDKKFASWFLKNQFNNAG